MSIEIITDLMAKIKSSHKAEFSEILDECFEYSLIEDTTLATLFEMDISDLEELMTDSSSLSKTDWNKYANKLYKYLKKESASYSILYYKDQRWPLRRSTFAATRLFFGDETMASGRGQGLLSNKELKQMLAQETIVTREEVFVIPLGMIEVTLNFVSNKDNVEVNVFDCGDLIGITTVSLNRLKEIIKEY